MATTIKEPVVAVDIKQQLHMGLVVGLVMGLLIIKEHVVPVDV